MRQLRPKQELFCLYFMETGNYSEAMRRAGYRAINPTQILRSTLVQARIEELKAKMKEEIGISWMTAEERRIRLSQIARAKLTDFMELGPDGSWVNIGKETPGSEAIAEIHSRTEYDDNGAHPTVHTSVKLHDPMKAIDLLNKMDKIYSDGAQVSVDNRKIEITVVSEEAKELTNRILLGEKT